MKEKPSRAILETITLLEQEIDALEQRRTELLRVIESLATARRRGLADARSPEGLEAERCDREG